MAYKDNFYEPYIRILTTEQAPIGTNLEAEDSFFGEKQFLPPQSLGRSPSQNTTILQISEAKALKAIEKYSVQKNGEEKNKAMFDAHILLAQARLYQDKPLEALDALSYLFNNMNGDKRLDLAKIYQGQAFAQLKDYYRADEVFRSLTDLKKEYNRLKTVYYSQMLVDAGKKDEAVAELENAFGANKNRTLRSRIAFLRGQILASLDKKEEARESFTSAYKLSNDFEFEVKSQVEIAKTFNGKNDDYEGAKQYLESISKKGTYASRKNEFYYALGLMAAKAGKNDEAQEFFKKSLAEKMSDPQVRGLTYYEIGRNYFSQNDYIGAGAYYDSAVAAMTYAPEKQRLTELASNIKNITKNYYLVKKNDSILALTRMSEPEREVFFTKYIDKLKEKEEKELALQKQEERTKGFDTGDYNANSLSAKGQSGFQDLANTGRGGGFYFANQNTVAKGNADFKQIWGNRALQDNWRFSNRMSTIQDVKNETMGLGTVRDPRRLETTFYTEKIPTDAEAIAALKKDRDTATLGLGRMYEDYFSNTALATKTLYDLADSKPDSETRLQALYQIFAMNYEKNPTAAERAKSMILADYPYTSYAEFVKNPKNTSFTKSSADVEAAYSAAFDLYSQGKYEDSRLAIESAIAKYPKDALVPKFALLNAYNAGKTAGKEIMILQLEQLALNYGKTMEGEKAKSILANLKSELKTELKDNTGKTLSPGNINPPGSPDTGPGQGTGSTLQMPSQINTSENIVQPGDNVKRDEIRRPPVPGKTEGTPALPPNQRATKGVPLERE